MHNKLFLITRNALNRAHEYFNREIVRNTDQNGAKVLTLRHKMKHTIGSAFSSILLFASCVSDTFFYDKIRYSMSRDVTFYCIVLCALSRINCHHLHNIRCVAPVRCHCAWHNRSINQSNKRQQTHIVQRN